MKYRISEKARQILNHLRAVARPIAPKSIAKALALNDNTVQSLLVNLRQRKLIEDKETTHIEFYQLTSEGRRFAANELPEIRLVKILAKQGGEGSVDLLANEKDKRRIRIIG